MATLEEERVGIPPGGAGPTAPAYGRLSAPNVAANERLRKGLHSDLRDDREREWVQAL